MVKPDKGSNSGNTNGGFGSRFYWGGIKIPPVSGVISLRCSMPAHCQQVSKRSIGVDGPVNEHAKVPALQLARLESVVHVVSTHRVLLDSLNVTQDVILSDFSLLLPRRHAPSYTRLNLSISQQPLAL
jgi:hypothetical protein